MKRPHRRAHVLIWLMIAPLVIAGLALAFNNYPSDPRAVLPDAIATEAP